MTSPNGMPGLLTGSYDCVDRIVLNAYFSVGHHPGGFRCWWRRLHGGSDDQLDNTHLMRMAARFARRVKAWAAVKGVPVIYCTAGQRKHLIAEEYLETHSVRPGIFLILAAKAPAWVWKVHRSARGVITRIEKKTEYVWPLYAGASGPRRPSLAPSSVNIVCEVIEGAGPNGVPGRSGAGRKG